MIWLQDGRDTEVFVLDGPSFELLVVLFATRLFSRIPDSFFNIRFRFKFRFSSLVLTVGASLRERYFTNKSTLNEKVQL